ncbi:MAG: rRNA maturation RNase YbeY [Gemmatimonadaceae bacterium]
MRDIRVSRDGVRVPLALARVEAVAAHVLGWERCTRPVAIGITFVSDRAIARLNRTHLGHDGATDIVTFEHAPSGEWAPIVGDIYIAPGVARKNARRFGSPVREELARLAIHGVLHAIGWEHPTGEGREQSEMWRRQERWLRRARAAGLLP